MLSGYRQEPLFFEENTLRAPRKNRAVYASSVPQVKCCVSPVGGLVGGLLAISL